MRIALIVNPVSGVGTSAVDASTRRIALATRLVRDSSEPIALETTTAAGHATDLARAFVSRGVDRLIVWGGDGTINEAAGPLIGTGITLGIVPSGSGDGLARGLGLPRDPDQAFPLAARGIGRPLDVGFIGDRHFLNIGGIGFDAAVAAVFNNRPTRGKRGYIVESLREVWSYKSCRYQVRAGPHATDGPCFVAAFANCRQYGSGIVIAPEADPADGLLDLVIVEGGPAWRQFWRARRLAFRRMARAEGVTRARVESASVTGDYLLAHVDGQTFEASGTLQVRVERRALAIAGALE